jgi:hypothetical protein
VYWTDSEGEVLLREDNERTVKVSGASAARFWTATPDGRYAFYSEGGQLWRFSSETDTREALAGAGAGVQGVIGASENGETVYYVATGVLAAGATAGQPNLYREDAGETTLVATLTAGDNDNRWYDEVASENAEVFGDWQPGLGARTAQVTPDGGAVVFMSQARLHTVNFPEGYDNTGCIRGVPVGCTEVYVYDAEGGGGSLFCVSCAPGGAPPPVHAADAPELASFVPIEWGATYMSRWVSSSGGRVFFDSLEPLVGRDSNGTLDVYEWERDGEGSCREGMGCVYLISSGAGTQTNASYLLDSSETGEDVFIATRSRLLAQDTNEGIDVYDAHVDGTQPVASGGCEADCERAPAASLAFAAPPTEAFDGSGNYPPPAAPSVKPPLTRAQKLKAALAACKKDKQKHRRLACEARARKTYPAKAKAKKSARTKKPAPAGRPGA